MGAALNTLVIGRLVEGRALLRYFWRRFFSSLTCAFGRREHKDGHRNERLSRRDQIVAEQQRIASLRRNTKETQIEVELGVDGVGLSEIDTGIPFFDHMLELFACHGLFDLKLKAVGDLDVDYHHTVEDTGLVLGQALKEALGEKRGIRRYGFFLLPMDESLARVALDLSNRQAFVYKVDDRGAMARDFNIGLVKEFFQAFANTACCNLHIQLEYGEEPHHIAEAIFKSFARALDMASAIDARLGGATPTTKGTLSQ